MGLQYGVFTDLTEQEGDGSEEDRVPTAFLRDRDLEETLAVECVLHRYCPSQPQLIRRLLIGIAQITDSQS